MGTGGSAGGHGGDALDTAFQGHGGLNGRIASGVQNLPCVDVRDAPLFVHFFAPFPSDFFQYARIGGEKTRLTLYSHRVSALVIRFIVVSA